MKNAIYFVESNGVKYFKCDTFWSKSKDYRNAKLHNDTTHDIERFFNSLTNSITNNNYSTVDDYKKICDFFEGSIYGYYTFEDTERENYTLKSDAILGEANYVYLIKDILDRKFTKLEYKVVNRENKINTILK